jgi:hypothetical protein
VPPVSDARQESLFPVGEPVGVLTVRQPWAWAIIHAGKDVENRGWTPRRTGRLLIHAGKGVDKDAFGALAAFGIEVPAEAAAGGLIIGAVEVTGWARDSPSRWAVPGQWHWLLADPRPAARPLPCRGWLNVFAPPPGWELALG